MGLVNVGGAARAAGGEAIQWAEEILERARRRYGS